ILERDGPVRRERRRRHPLLVAEYGRVERQRAEAAPPGRERELEHRVAGRGLADAEDVAVRGDENARGRAGRLDPDVDDHPEELVDVVRRRESVAEPRERVADSLALGLELVEASLELL